MFLFALAVLPLVLAEPNARIIDGTDVTDATKYPWQGSLESLGSHTCGCVLLSEHWVLTAAHCIVGTEEGNRFDVVFGSTTRGAGTNYEVAEKIQHEDFRDRDTPGAYPNDIGLIRTNLSIELNDNVRPIRLDRELSEDSCVITGWGRTGEGLALPETLQEASISVLSHEQASAAWGEEYNGDIHICVQDLEDFSSGACNGDSGGPLSCVASDGEMELRGVTSWGVVGCNTEYPSTYTRVNTYLDWICTNTGGAVGC